jgi:hypothetical protein
VQVLALDHVEHVGLELDLVLVVVRARVALDAEEQLATINSLSGSLLRLAFSGEL